MANYGVSWRDDKNLLFKDLNKYFSEDVQSQRQGAYIYSRLPRNHIQLCQQVSISNHYNNNSYHIFFPKLMKHIFLKIIIQNLERKLLYVSSIQI